MKTIRTKFYSFVLVFTMLGLLSAQSQCFTPLFPSGNLILDTECSNYPNSSVGWSKNWGNGTSISGANAFCGTSIQVTGSCGGSIDYSLTGKLLSNTSYHFKCMLYSDKDAFITLNGMGINGSTSDFQVTKNTGSTWQIVEFDFRTGTLASGQNLWINSCTGSNRATDIRLDNLEIYQKTDPIITTSVSSVWLNGTTINTFTVSGSNLIDAVTLSAPSGVTLSTYSIPANQSDFVVAITYDGVSEVKDTIRLTSGSAEAKIAVISASEQMATGTFQPTWESLSQFDEAPEWYQDAKFGIWAHWGPQCQPEQGDWYARFMYYSGTSQFNWHASNYGNQSVFGFKDVINTWKAQNWNPDSLVHLYKNAGAEYFFAMANHHDNLDMWDSKYQPWNTTKVGPKKDIIAGWADASKKYGLPFGVSVHSSHAWTWLEPSQDYDGKLTAADGIGKWWEGLDPQDLYAQNHARSSGSSNSGTIHTQWEWENGASIPDAAYINNFYNRTVDLINQYNPDLIYFDDTALPFSKISNVGLDIAAHLYNKSAAANNGKNESIIFGKVLTEDQKNCLVWDVERGVPDRPQQKYWQTCTCIGDWHYNRNVYNGNKYKSAQTVVRMLIDIVSKNGNLLLNIPVRGDGSIDEKELAIVQGITAWMNVNKESIHGTRTWSIFGEGPTAETVNPIFAQGFNEGTTYNASDIRYVKKGDSLLYVTTMGWPANGKVVLKKLGTTQPYLVSSIKSIKLVGGGELTYSRSIEGLTINLPATKLPTSDVATVFKITLDSVSLESLMEMIRVAEVNDSIALLNTGSNCGQYTSEAVAALEAAITEAYILPDCDCVIGKSQLDSAITTLQSAIIAFQAAEKADGGFIPLFETGNLVDDPDCVDYPNASSGWSKNWGNGAVISDNKAFCGSSIQITGSCGGSIDYKLTGKLLSNTKYRIKCMLYSDKDAYITLNGCGINGSTSDYQIVKNTGGAWQEVEFDFTTGTLATDQYFWLNSCTGSNRATDIRLDNFELYNMSLSSTLGIVSEEKQVVSIQGNSIVADFDLAQHSEVEISVFNAQGILLKKVKENYNAGKSHKVINVNMATGVYLVKVSSAGGAMTMKLLK